MYERPPAPEQEISPSPYPRSIGESPDERLADLASAYLGFEGVLVGNIFMDLVIWAVAAGAGHGEHYSVGVLIYGFILVGIAVGVLSYPHAISCARGMGRPRSFALLISTILALQAWSVLGLVGGLFNLISIGQELKKHGVQGRVWSLNQSQLHRLVSQRGQVKSRD